jgi:predicted site-specific integrase-resolvase
MSYTEMATINQTLARAKAEGLGIPETALRRWVKNGDVPAVYAGNKALIYWPALMAFLSGKGA